ncbi:Possible RNA methyltransferase aq_898 [hydrothermal vent metagenome]|uniref:Possible RNA methyltransferase aq_898 n=1 Tax=hydrothermal vent metagenome TaxID=652676 RepID=A0A3B0VEK7_9ZZZZ
MTKAVALLSGGLDSTLAVKMMIDQGIEVHALNFTSAFCTCDSGKKDKDGNKIAGCKSQAVRVAEEFGIPIKVLHKGMEYVEIVRNPKHGYGKGINPCMDCRVFMFRLAKKYMAEIGAEFAITGEVLGQRPMSQRLQAMELVERESDMVGRILRPLCAKQMKPTIAEETGLVDREKMLGVTGRSRRPQIELAEEIGVADYPCPSGGCLLTDKIFSKKIRDLLDHKAKVTTRDLTALKYGRHFRTDGTKIIVSRGEAENKPLINLAQEGDTLLVPEDFPGPVAIVTGENQNGAVDTACRIMLRYSPKAGGKGTIKATLNSDTRIIKAEGTMDEAATKDMLVC